MEFSKTARYFAFLLGIIYVFLIGFLKSSQNFQTTIFNLIFLGVLLLLMKAKQIKLTKTVWFLTFAYFVISIYLGITTNGFLQVINFWSTNLISWIFLLVLTSNGKVPQSAAELLKQSFHYIGAIFIAFFTAKNYRDFLFTWGEVKKPEVKLSGRGILVAIPILLIFHAFLAQVNSEYASFMSNILTNIWNFLRWIWEIDILQILIKVFLSSLWFYMILVAEVLPKEKIEGEKAVSSKEIIETVLFCVAGLFLIFFVFQIQTLFVAYSPNDFKELSLFTQKGFWELIWVSVMGYVLCLFTGSQNHLRKFLAFFTGELIAMILFSFHKLSLLVFWFGLKDQRILAFFAIILILMTFILFVAKIFGKINQGKIFQVQLMAFLIVAVFLNVINLDLFVTRVHPISNYVNQKKYKDYSYLLGNSYDNSSEWVSLMNEASVTGAPQPKDYYWGDRYLPLCENYPEYDRNINAYRISRFTAKTYLKNKFNNLIAKYERPFSLHDFNLNEYQAAKVLRENKKEVDKFLEFVKTQCVKGY